VPWGDVVEECSASGDVEGRQIGRSDLTGNVTPGLADVNVNWAPAGESVQRLLAAVNLRAVRSPM
jgi:hypothetical protein